MEMSRARQNESEEQRLRTSCAWHIEGIVAMKGVLFNVVEDVVTEALSADAWDAVVDESGVGGAYTSLGTYPDAELGEIVCAAARAAKISETETLRLTGRLGFKHLVRRAPHLLDGIDDWKSVLRSLDEIIHPEVRKIYPDADVPGFSATDDGEVLVMVYTSKRGLCALADGLVVGSGEWFGAALSVEHTTCVHNGDESCTMRVAEVR